MKKQPNAISVEQLEHEEAMSGLGSQIYESYTDAFQRYKDARYAAGYDITDNLFGFTYNDGGESARKIVIEQDERRLFISEIVADQDEEDRTILIAMITEDGLTARLHEDDDADKNNIGGLSVSTNHQSLPWLQDIFQKAQSEMSYYRQMALREAEEQTKAKEREEANKRQSVKRRRAKITATGIAAAYIIVPPTVAIAGINANVVDALEQTAVDQEAKAAQAESALDTYLEGLTAECSDTIREFMGDGTGSDLSNAEADGLVIEYATCQDQLLPVKKARELEDSYLRAARKHAKAIEDAEDKDSTSHKIAVGFSSSAVALVGSAAAFVVIAMARDEFGL